MAVKRESEADLCMKVMLTEIFGLEWVREWQFAPPRKWKFDFAVPGPNIAVEIEGGVFSTKDKFGRLQRGVQGRHNRAKGFIQDLEKYNTATKLGWRVFRFSTADVLQRKPMEFLR